MKKEIEKQAVDMPTVLKYMGGGALLGGGAAATAALVRLLLNLNDEKNKESDTSLDDSTIYINLKGTGKEQKKVKKEASVKEAVNSDTATMSYLGMALAAYLGYTGVNKVFNRVRESRLQKELDLAQQVYIDRIGPPPADFTDKEASVKSAISRPTFAMTVAKALPLLIALGTAVAAYRVLDKNSPLPKKTSVKPKRIVLRTQKTRRESSIPEDLPIDDVESLLRTTMAKESRANENGLHDLVSHVSNEGLESFKDKFKNYGFDTALNMIKGARFDNKSALDKNLAISIISRDEMLKPSLELLAASEFYDMSPGIMKSAQALPLEIQDALLKSSRELLLQSSSEIFKPVLDELKRQVGADSFEKLLQKKAVVGEIGTMMTLKNMFMGKDNSEDSEDSEDSEENVENAGKLLVPSSKSSDDKEYNDEKTDKKKLYLQIQDKESKKFWTKNKDIIDEALALS
jgi:hypothetical protein